MSLRRGFFFFFFLGEGNEEKEADVPEGGVSVHTFYNWKDSSIVWMGFREGGGDGCKDVVMVDNFLF